MTARGACEEPIALVGPKRNEQIRAACASRMTTGVSSADVAKRVAAKVTHSLWGEDPDPESPILDDYRADPVCGHFFRAPAPPPATTRLRSELVRNRRREARLAPLTTKKAFGTVARVVRRSLDSFHLEPPAELALDRPHADPNDSFVGTVTATAAALGRRAPAIEPADPELLRKLVDSGDMAHVIFRESCEGEGARASLTWWNSRAETRRAERVQGRGLATFLAAARGPHEELDPTGAQVREQFHSTVDVRSWLAASAPTEAFHDRSRFDPLDTTVGPDARVLKGRQTPSLEYVRNPRFRSRTELLAHRRSLLKPAPKSYDLDGDGVVTEAEAFFAAYADRDGNYSLDDEERKRVLELMVRHQRKGQRRWKGVGEGV